MIKIEIRKIVTFVVDGVLRLWAFVTLVGVVTFVLRLWAQHGSICVQFECLSLLPPTLTQRRSAVIFGGGNGADFGEQQFDWQKTLSAIQRAEEERRADGNSICESLNGHTNQ